MYEIKIRYVLKNTRTGDLLMEVHTLDSIENSSPRLSNIPAGYILIGRDMYTGCQDKDKKDIFENDSVTLHVNSDEYINNPQWDFTGKVEWKGYWDGEYVGNVECWQVDNHPLSENKKEGYFPYILTNNGRYNNA